MSKKLLHQCDTITDIYYDDRSYDGAFMYTRYIAKGTAYVPKEVGDDRKMISGAESLREFIKKNSD